MSTNNPIWDHYNGDRLKANCKYCDQSYSSGKITRMRNHLLKQCDKIPSTVKADLNASLAPPLLTRPVSAPPSLPRRSLSSPPAKKKCDRQLLLEPFVDSMRPEELSRCQELLVRSLITGGIPLNFLANEELKEFLRVLRPGFTVPNRDRAQKVIVTKIYEEEKAIIDRSIATAKNVALSTDGWKDINKNHMMNFIVHTPTEWLHSFEPEKDSDADYISSKVLKLVAEIGPEKVTSLVTDHASAMMKTGKLVAEKYNWISHSGCQGHGLNLGCKDICKTKVFKTLLSKSNTIICFFGHKHALDSLKTAFANQNLKEKKLQHAVETRFSTYFTSIKSILYAKNAIREAANYPKLDRQNNISDVRRYVNDQTFWKNLQEMMLILKPLSLAIFKLETSMLEFGEGRNIVKLAFAETLNNIDKSVFNASFKNVLGKVLEKRRKFCSNDLDYAYALLDPRQKGNQLSSDERTLALKKLDQIKTNPRINQRKLDQELRLWVAGGEQFDHDSYPEAWKSLESNITPKQWWLLYFNKTELSKAVSMIVATPLASTASERTWSVRGFVHSKARNRLSLSAADKLVFLKYNLALQKKKLKKREKAEKQLCNGIDEHEIDVEEIQLSEAESTLNAEYDTEEEDLDDEDDNEIINFESETGVNESNYEYFSSSSDEDDEEIRDDYYNNYDIYDNEFNEIINL